MSDVRVGIVSWNTAEQLDRCLAALPEALAPLDAEVVVVDNASSDGSADVASRYNGVTVVRNAENRGYAVAMNQALSGSAAPVLVALNPDTIPPPGSLTALAQRLLDDDALGLVAPQLQYLDGRLQHSVYRFPSIAVAASVCLLPAAAHGGAVGRRFWLEGHAPHDRRQDVDWAIGAVHVIRAEALGGLPPYSQRSFIYTEDLDLCWRLKAGGWRVEYDPSVVVVHESNVSGRQAFGVDRTLRWLEATYGWMWSERGALHTRLWAAINAAGVALDIVAGLPRALLAGDGRSRRRGEIRQLARQLRTHVRHLVRPASRVSARDAVPA